MKIIPISDKEINFYATDFLLIVSSEQLNLQAITDHTPVIRNAALQLLTHEEIFREKYF